ncbi:MAG: 1-acyl-sn-glycerol-3-phosphate acyltransferase [Sandaracinaceae bacterium]|nr:1-acyl-sn-glycerol-3-phosphate acyltransferase [Myxococcales bacterium]MCB9657174.1 1-acyl-sn-glycerol-3-phosphate acyltransferase [Sandaracinaceae bacterium]
MQNTLVIPESPLREARRSSSRLGRTTLLIAEALANESLRSADALRGDSLARASRLSFVAQQLCAVHGVRVHVSGEVPKQAVALAANHLSYLDPLAVLSCLPASAIAKREVREWPGVGATLDALGVLFVDRDDPQSGARVVRQAATRLASDVSVLAFPEGTTTSGRGVLPFRRGLFGAARIARVPVVPVALRYEDPDLPWVGSQLFLPHYLRTASKPVTHVHIHFFAPLEVREGDEARCAKHARDMVREWIAPTVQA